DYPLGAGRRLHLGLRHALIRARRASEGATTQARRASEGKLTQARSASEGKLTQARSASEGNGPADRHQAGTDHSHARHGHRLPGTEFAEWFTLSLGERAGKVRLHPCVGEGYSRGSWFTQRLPEASPGLRGQGRWVVGLESGRCGKARRSIKADGAIL